MKLRNSAAAPTTVAAQILNGEARPRAVLLQNVGAVNVYIGFNGAADLTSLTGILLAVGRERVFICSGAVCALAASSTGDLRIVEGLSDHVEDVVAQFTQELQLNVGGISNAAGAGHVGESDGANIIAAPIKIETGAITAGTTATSVAAGVLGITTHATGRGILFRSDGSHWQLLNAYADESKSVESATIATTGNTDKSFLAPFAGVLSSVDFSGVETLAADDTNYITWTITNLGQDGLGTNPMLAATDANTTKATGGTGLVALTKRALTINGTPSNLVIAKGDRIRIRAAATGTLGAPETLPLYSLTFTRTV